jgi:hypothetical protein
MVEVFLYPIYLLHYYFVFSEHNYFIFTIFNISESFFFYAFCSFVDISFWPPVLVDNCGEASSAEPFFSQLLG